MLKVVATEEIFGGKYLARGGASHVLEEMESHSLVIVEFPDMPALLAWYDSPDYALKGNSKKLRGHANYCRRRNFLAGRGPCLALPSKVPKVLRVRDGVQSRTHQRSGGEDFPTGYKEFAHIIGLVSAVTVIFCRVEESAEQANWRCAK